MKKILIVLLFPLIGFSQVSITGTGSYSQNFDGLLNTGTNIPWTDNSTILNWYSQKSTAAAMVYDAAAGTSNAGKLYSFGTVAAFERALGTVGSGGFGNGAHGVQLQNNSGSLINNFSVSYTLEQWRDGGNPVPVAQQIQVYYQVSSALIASLTPGTNTIWTQVPALMTASPIFNIAASALDGNLPANRVSLTTISIPGLVLNNGEYLMLKWEDPNHAGNDHGLSIDDVSIAWTISCNTLNTISPSACLTYTVPSGDETYTSSGTYMDTIPNAALCDSIITINLTITAGSITYYADTDLDGLGNPLITVLGCVQPVGYVTNSDDCDDTNNGIGAATNVYYLDFDNDTYGTPLTTITACSQPVGYVSNMLDCNDVDALINPVAFDILDNGIDEDCSGSDASSLGTDIGMYEFTQLAACPMTSISVTAQPLNALFSDYASTGTTCSPAANVFSTSAWNMTGTIDLNEYNEFTVTANDCSTLDLNRIIFTHRISASGGTPTWFLRSSVDNFVTDLGTGTPLITDRTDTVNLTAAFDALTQVTFRFYITNIGGAGSTWRNDNVRIIANFGTLTPQTYFADTDADGYGDASSSISTCTAMFGYVLDNTDCDDTDGLINPATIWYQDIDGDLSGNNLVSLTQCAQPVGYVLNPGDCDDNNNLIINPTTYYLDADGDGHGSVTGLAIASCTNPGAGYVTISDDCDDSANTVYPGAPELCDGMDNDCNGSFDDGLVFNAYFTDTDNDTYGTGTGTLYCQDPGTGYSLIDGDCDDSNPNAYPGATEILDNGIDENCDLTDNYAGLNNLDNIVMTLYPNPSTGVFQVNFNQLISGRVECMDLNGKTLSVQTIENSFVLFDLTSISNGTYILKIISDNGNAQQRIVIQK